MAKGVDYRNIFDQESGKTNLVASKELIVAELTMLLNFKRYSLFFGNNMGLDCEKYLNVTNRTAQFNLLKADIENLFRKYKRAYIKKIEMKFNDSRSSIDIDITCGITGSYNQYVKIPLSLSN